MHYLSLCAIFKNEAHIMEEWIKHYLYHGVDHFYMIDDRSDDNYMDIINKYIESGLVTLYHTKDVDPENITKIRKVHNRQGIFYDHFVLPLKHETKWLAVVDLDEFLYSAVEIDIKNILKKHEDIHTIQVDWLTFGSNGFIEQPKNVVESFIKRCDYYNSKKIGIYSFKSISQTQHLKSIGIHGCKFSVEINSKFLSYEDNPENPQLIINHYSVQSLNLFLKIKAVRGDCDNYLADNTRDLNYFKKWDVNELIDERLKNQNRDIV